MCNYNDKNTKKKYFEILSRDILYLKFQYAELHI